MFKKPPKKLDPFQKILWYMDFAKGQKTTVSLILTFLAASLSLVFREDVSQEVVEGNFWIIFHQVEVILTASGILYGLAMKLLRKFG